MGGDETKAREQKVDVETPEISERVARYVLPRDLTAGQVRLPWSIFFAAFGLVPSGDSHSGQSKIGKDKSVGSLLPTSKLSIASSNLCGSSGYFWLCVSTDFCVHCEEGVLQVVLKVVSSISSILGHWDL